MSSFKEQLEADLDVFVNGDEFSDVHTIQGIDVQAVFQGLNSRDVLTKIAKHSVDFEGIDGRTVIMHLKTAELPEDVVNGNVIEVDGEIYRVMDVVDDMGITTLTLGADMP